jgi:ATP-dependent Lon protease
MTTDTDNLDDLDLPNEYDLASTGAAAESVELDEKLKGLPRILRYAILANRHGAFIRERLVAEIAELAPSLALIVAWAGEPNAAIGIALATELDRLAVTKDQPDLRGIADCIRLLSLPLPNADTSDKDHHRVAKALLQALRQLPSDADPKLAAEIETISFGWAALPLATDPLSRLGDTSALDGARAVGRRMAHWRVEAAEAALRKRFAEEKEARGEANTKTGDQTGTHDRSDDANFPEDHVLVCPMTETAMKNPKMKEVIGPLKAIVNTPLPLVPVPPLHAVRGQLIFEFPYAVDVIDFALADLVGRRTVRLRPLLLVGDPGGGESRFARRLGEILGVGIWRTDASRSDGAVFGGTDKRWYSAEACHPFLAVAQARQANPMVLIDEIEKAGTRSDYGRFWDCLLGFLEPETATRYPDPALQTTLDLGHVSYVATANALDSLPSPLRDRFRIVTFPKPAPEHLEALLAPVIADLATERGLSSHWIEPLNGFERDAIAAHWRGGSVRRLRRIVEIVLRARENAATRN